MQGYKAIVSVDENLCSESAWKNYEKLICWIYALRRSENMANFAIICVEAQAVRCQMLCWRCGARDSQAVVKIAANVKL